MPNLHPQEIVVEPPASAEDISFANWRQIPETQRFFRYLKDKRDECKENWAQRMYVKKTDSESEANNYEALGSVAVLEDLLNLTNSDIEDFYRAE